VLGWIHYTFVIACRPNLVIAQILYIIMCFSSCSQLSTCARGNGSPFLNQVGRPEPDAQVANQPSMGLLQQCCPFDFSNKKLNFSLGPCICFQIQKIDNTQKTISLIFDFEVARPAPNNSRCKNGARQTLAAGASKQWPPLSWPCRPRSDVHRLRMDLYRRVAEVALQILEDFQRPTSATFAGMAVHTTPEMLCKVSSCQQRDCKGLLQL
jgi:hypothetical protein